MHQLRGLRLGQHGPQGLTMDDIDRIGLTPETDGEPFLVLAHNTSTQATWVEVWQDKVKIAETAVLSDFHKKIIMGALG